MKKFFALCLMLFAALILTNCAKEESVAPVVANDFVVYADLGATRTVADGYQTSWVTGDNLNIFHAPAGESTYVSDGEFTLTNAELGTFEGQVASLAGNSYDWYAIYPYSSYNTTPARTGYMTIAAQTQTQAGDNNTAHTGEAPLYGVIKGGSAAAPEFSMKHLSSMIKVNVTNTLDEAVSIKSILVETQQTRISGTYYVDITGEVPTYESSGDSYTFNSVTLNVTGGGKIQPEASASYYLTICPFAVAIGQSEKLTVTVTDMSDEVSVREYTIPAGKRFAAGKVTTLNFDFAADAETSWTTIADIHAADAEGIYNIQNATVVVKMAKSCLLKDATGYLYSYQNLDVAVGDVINLRNAQTSTYGKRQIKSGAEIEKIGTTTVTHPTATNIADGAAFDALATSFSVGDYISVDASKITVGNYINFYVDGATYKGSLVAPVEDISQFNNQAVRITGYAGYVVSPTYFYLFMTDIQYVEHFLTPTTTSLSWSATDLTAKTVAITTDVDWTVTSAPSWVTAEHTNKTTLTVTPTENKGAERVDNIVLTHTQDANVQAVITVVQGASEATIDPNASYYTKVTTAPADWSGNYLIVYEVDTSNGCMFNGADAASNNAEVVIRANTIEVSDATEENEIIIAPLNSGYSLQVNPKNKNWADYYMSGQDGINKIVFMASPQLNTLEMEGGVITITSNTSVFAFNNNSNNMRFRYFKPATVSGNPTNFIKPALYKRVN